MIEESEKQRVQFGSERVIQSSKEEERGYKKRRKREKRGGR